jgi:MGT family glycosyltransferase
MTVSPRTYLFALVDGGGTVPPELGAVRRLVERGHDVTVVGEDSIVEDVRASGATFRPWVQAPNRPSRLPEHDPYKDWECKNPFELFSRLLDTQFVGPAPGYAADVTAAIADHRPDLVVCSFFAYGAMVAAEAAGIPFDILMPNAYLLPARGMPPLGLGVKPAAGPLGRGRDRLVTALVTRQWNKGLPRLNALRASLGLDPLDSFFEQAHRAHRQLVLTSPDFDFPAELPATARYVGAVLDDPAWATGIPWAPPVGDGPLVLVAMSSTFQDQGACLQRIVDALGMLPVRGIVTTGPALDPDALRAPANVTVVAAAPHSEVLRHTSAVVTHGGHGTVVRTLAADVPMVILHHGRDQADNATRVTTRGAGLAVKRTATPAVIAAAVQRLLDDPAFASGARQLGESIRRDAASGALVAELEGEPVAESVSGRALLPST